MKGDSGAAQSGRRFGRRTGYVGALALLTAAFAVAALAGYELAVIEDTGLAAWPASGVGLAGLAIGGLHLWPAIFLGRLAAALIAGSQLPLWSELALSAVHVVATVASVALMRRLRTDPALQSVSSMMRYIVVGSGVGALMAAVGGSAVLALAAGLDAEQSWTTFQRWLFGWFAGAVIIGSLIQSWWYDRKIDRAWYLVLILSVLTAVCWLLLMREYASQFRSWHIMPFLLWAALAFGVRGASAALVILTVFCVWQTSLGYAYFTDFSLTLADRLALLQQFVAIAAATVLLLAAFDEERSRKVEERLRLALDAAGQGVFQFEGMRRQLRCDRTCRHLFGLGDDEETVTIGRLATLVHPDDRAAFERLVANLAGRAKKGLFRAEFRILRPNGPPRWISLHGRTEFEGIGRRRRAVRGHGVVRDVSARRRSEDRIRESERFVRRVLDNLFAFVGVLKPDGTVVEINQAPLEAAGLAAGDVIGRKYWDCYWWNYSPAAQQQLREAAARASRGEVVRYDARIRIAGGALMWLDFQIAPLRDDCGHVTHLIPSGTDLTARKTAEDDLKDMVSIIEATPDFVGIVDPGGRIIYVNPGGKRLVGVDESEPLVGRPLRIVHPAQAAEFLTATALPTARRDGLWEGQTEVVRASGERVPVSQVVLAHRDEAGTVRHYSTIMRDMTEQKHAEENQRMLLRELAHRVRNTLAIIQSITRQTLRSNPEPKRFAEVFQGRVASLAASHDLLMQSGHSAGLRDIIRWQLAPVHGETDGRLTLDGPELTMPPDVATKLGLVLHELGTNAVKHGAWSAPAGTVGISWKVANGSIELVWTERGGPPIAEPPARHGFGSNLIDMSVETIDRRFDPEGLTFAFRIPFHREPVPA